MLYGVPCCTDPDCSVCTVAVVYALDCIVRLFGTWKVRCNSKSRICNTTPTCIPSVPQWSNVSQCICTCSNNSFSICFKPICLLIKYKSSKRGPNSLSHAVSSKLFYRWTFYRKHFSGFLGNKICSTFLNFPCASVWVCNEQTLSPQWVFLRNKFLVIFSFPPCSCSLFLRGWSLSP